MKKNVFIVFLIISSIMITSCNTKSDDIDTSQLKSDVETDYFTETTDCISDISITDMLRNASIRNQSEKASDMFVTSLYQWTGKDGYDDSEGYYDIYKTKCAVLKIIPCDYDFYIHVDQYHDPKTEDKVTSYIGYSIVTARVIDVIQNFNESSVAQNDVIKLRLHVYIVPNDEYMDEFIDIYGNGNESEIPEGAYKINVDKLKNTGIKKIITWDSPLLFVNTTYYTFAITEQTSGIYAGVAFCYDNLEPVKMGDAEEHNLSTDGVYDIFNKELIKMIKEIKQ